MKKGFTLIELLIVIGILAILATTVVLVLNPAQILQESRDTQRISDLSTIQSAVGLMLATDASIPDFANQPRCTFGGATPCAAVTVGIDSCAGFTNTDASVGGTAADCVIPVAADLRKVDGNGWVGIDLTGTAGGSPVANLPNDPTNDLTYYYAYISRQTTGNDTQYELNGRLESAKLRTNMQNDGGDDNTCTTFKEATCWYELGNEPGLDL